MEKTRKRATALERERHITMWQQSGKSKLAYSRLHTIPYYTFISWFKKATIDDTTNVTPNFLKIDLASPSHTVVENFATLEFSNQLIVTIHQEVSAQFLKQLILCR